MGSHYAPKRGITAIDLVLHLRFALRQIRRQPLFTIAIVLTLGLAIGANTAIFSFVNALLIRPFPFRDPDQLFEIRTVRGGQIGKMSGREVLDIQERVSVIEAIAGHTGAAGGYNFSGDGGRPQEWRAILTTGNLFDVLGVPLAAGSKWPLNADLQRDNRVILSHAAWQTSFGGQNVIGKSITLDHAPGYTVDGVAPRGFDFPSGVEVYRSIGGFASYDKRDVNRNLVAVARIKRPYSLDRLQQELDALSRRLAEEYPSSNAGLSFRAESFRDLYSGSVRPYLLILLGAVALVLLIACANAANLLLSRAVGREREIAVRLALGAGAREIIGLLIVESMVLSLLAAWLGLGLAYWWMHLLRALIGSQMPTWMVVEMDARVLALTVAISVVAGIVAGLAPAYQLWRGAHHDLLKEASRGSSVGRVTGRLRDWIVVGEIALAVVLLSTAGLLIQGFVRLQSQEKGFNAASIGTFRVALGWKRYIDQPSISRYYERSLEALRQVPGIENAAFISNPPLARQEESAPATVQKEGQGLDQALGNPYVNHQSVSENYLRFARIPLLAGREFSEFDGPNAEPVAIVSHRLAQILWPGENPMGRRLRYNPTARTPGPLRKVIGVAANVRHRDLAGEASLEMYVPYRQYAEPNQYLLARTTLGLADFKSRAEHALWAIDSEQSMFDFKMYEQRILDSVWQLRLSRMLLTLLGAVALVLASIGIYGVIAFLVGQRAREIGIRLALGATPSGVQRLILGKGLLLGSFGVGLGLVTAIASARWLGSLLPNVGTGDFRIMAVVVGVLFAVTIAASALPAWRASQIEPTSLLREE